MTILSRLIIRDLLTVTLLALVAVTGLITVLGALFEGGKTGLDPLSILRLLPYIVAPSLPFTVPACLLFACTYVFGTMSGTNEIVAVKAGGINAMKLVRPAIVLSILVSVGCVYLSDQIIPWCQKQLRMSLLEDIETTLFSYLRQKSCIAGPDFDYELYVKTVDDKRLVQPIIKHRQPDGGYDFVLQAREATLKIEPSAANPALTEIAIRLVDGALTTNPGSSAYFRDRTERMPVPELIKGDGYAIADRSFAELDEQAAQCERESKRSKYQMTVALTLPSLMGSPEIAGRSAQASSIEIEFRKSQAYRSICEKHNRFSRSLAAIPFVMLGCPLSILYRRREVLRTFFICFLPIITIYYPSMILSYNILKETRSHFFILLLAPSIIMTLAAIPFIRQVIRH